MIIIGLLAIAAAFALVGALLIATIYRRRIPEALRGDWWPEFERAFREYDGRIQDQRAPRSGSERTRSD